MCQRTAGCGHWVNNWQHPNNPRKHVARLGDLSLAWRSSVPTPAGDEVAVVAPPSYVFRGASEATPVADASAGT